MLRLSVLDQSTVVTGRSPDTSIRESLALAKHCEALGYTRYWCAEHHNSASQAGTAPEILISAIAATTSRIRVGSAGVMLPHYSSLKIAEQFRVLEAIAPGRIDLGLGRAPGSDGRTAFALNPLAETAADHFPAQVRDLLAWLSGEKLVEGHPFRDIIAQPGGPTLPEVWMLGSSDFGPQVAAYFGIPFCFAHFITDGRGVEQAMALYRETYRPVRGIPRRTRRSACGRWPPTQSRKPRGCSAHARCGGSAATAVYIQNFRRPRKLPFIPIPARNSKASSACAPARSTARPQVVGDKLRALAAQHGVEEIAILTTLHDPQARRHSYTLLAKEFDLCSSS